jgi:hypothetical protein
MEKYLSPDKISFYDETLKKQIEGSYRYDGKVLHVSSMKYGVTSSPPGRLGTRVDHVALESYVQKLLSQLAHDVEAEKDSVTPYSLKKAA